MIGAATVAHCGYTTLNNASRPADAAQPSRRLDGGHRATIPSARLPQRRLGCDHRHSTASVGCNHWHSTASVGCVCCRCQLAEAAEEAQRTAETAELKLHAATAREAKEFR